MKLSLSTRVFLAYAVVAVIFGGSVFFLIQRFSRVFDRVVRVHKVMDSTTEDLRMLDRELRQIIYSFKNSNNIKSIAKHVVEMDIRMRLKNAKKSIFRVKNSGDWSRDVTDVAQKVLVLLESTLSENSAVIRARRVSASSLLAEVPATDLEYLEALAMAVSECRDMHGKIVVETVNEIRPLLVWVHSRVSRAAAISSSLSRLAYIQLDRQINRTYTVSLIVPIVALFSSVLVMLLVLLWLKPVAFLVKTVKRIAAGNYDLKPRSLGVREFDQLGEAIFQLAGALKTRDQELKQHQRNLLMSERMAAVGKTASVMAHEIRNPLNSISLNIDILKEKLQDSGGYAEIEAQMRILEREVTRLSNISSEYLRFGRMPRTVMGPCDLVALLKDLLAFMDEEFVSSRIRIISKLPKHSVMITADSERLRQAFMNLFKNAIDAMKQVQHDRTLEIGVEERDGKVLIWVHDSGPGISDDIMKDLFEPFASTKPGGTGLGLAFVHQVVSETGGRVWAENSDGAVFYIELRRRNDAQGG